MKTTLVIIVLMGLASTGLCLKCYEGKGDVGSKEVKEEEDDDFKACKTETVVDKNDTDITRRGVKAEKKAECKEPTKDGEKTTTICYCTTDLCNSASATVIALMPIIAMALLVKRIS